MQHYVHDSFQSFNNKIQIPTHRWHQNLTVDSTHMEVSLKLLFEFSISITFEWSERTILIRNQSAMVSKCLSSTFCIEIKTFSRCKFWRKSQYPCPFWKSPLNYQTKESSSQQAMWKVKEASCYVFLTLKWDHCSLPILSTILMSSVWFSFKGTENNGVSQLLWPVVQTGFHLHSVHSFWIQLLDSGPILWPISIRWLSTDFTKRHPHSQLKGALSCEFAEVRCFQCPFCSKTLFFLLLSLTELRPPTPERHTSKQKTI